MNPTTTTFDFGPTQEPTLKSPVLTVVQPLNFGLPASVPEWFQPFQARLTRVETLVEENQRLRKELTAAKARIAELEANKPQQQIQQQQQPKSRVGIEASMWSPSSPATTNTKTKPASPAPVIAPAPYKAAALKGKKAVPPAPKPAATRPRKALSSRQLQVVARTFTPVSGTHGYQYIYLPSRFRESISSARGKLAKLRLENSRILHLYYPTRRVVAILVHNDYVKYALTALSKAGIKPLEDFDPRDPANLHDSKYANLTNVERHFKMCEIHTTSLLRALDRIRVEVRPSVARSFLNKAWITSAYYQEVLHKSRPTRQASSAISTPLPDTNMIDVDSQEQVPLTQAQPSPTGTGEPSEEQL